MPRETAIQTPIKLFKKNLPRHVGIIMDGNGRWAGARKKPRYLGHKEGLEAAKRVVKAASEIGLRYLSVFAFSTENWQRAAEEVDYLMWLVKKYLKREFEFYKANRIRLVYSGDLTRLRRDVAQNIKDVIRDTSRFEGLTLNIALNYGGRDEIVRAVAKCLAAAPAQSLTEKAFKKYLDQPDFPDLDLLIRSGGEKRISNFLLWQSAYAELYFSEKLWPDWTGDDLKEAVADFQKRQRRFGKAK